MMGKYRRRKSSLRASLNPLLRDQHPSVWSTGFPAFFWKTTHMRMCTQSPHAHEHSLSVCLLPLNMLQTPSRVGPSDLLQSPRGPGAPLLGSTRLTEPVTYWFSLNFTQGYNETDSCQWDTRYRLVGRWVLQKSEY